MKESVKQEIHHLIDECDNEEVLEDAKNLLLSATAQHNVHELETEDTPNSAPVKNNASLDEVFGLWKERKVSLSKIRKQQWERKAE